jgi:hypothetical protein
MAALPTVADLQALILSLQAQVANLQAATRLHFPFLKYLFLFFLGKSGKIFYFTYFS